MSTAPANPPRDGEGPHTEGGDPSPGRTTGILALVALVAFITTIDNTVVTIAVPTIRRSLHMSLASMEWVSTGYILAYASQLLAGGHVVDLIGRRRCLMIGLVVFGAASLAAGASGDGAELITSRVIQGGGAALAMPALLSILAIDLAGPKLALGTAVATAAIALALSLGPVASGLIVQHAPWGVIFLVNVPVVIVAVIVARISLPPQQPNDEVARLDMAGVVTSTVAMAAFTWVLIEGHGRGFTSPLIIVAVLVGAVNAAWFGRHERHTPHPLVTPDLFRNRAFNGGTIAQTLWGIGLNGVFFFTSVFLQEILHLSPGSAGLAFVPLALAIVVFVPLQGPLLKVLGPARLVAVALGIVAVGLLVLARVPADAGIPGVIPGLVLIGAGSGLTNALTTAVLETFSQERAGIASATVSVARELSGALGIAIVGAIVAARQSSVRAAGGSSSSAFVSGYRLGLTVAAICVASGGAVAWSTLPGRRPQTLPAATTTD